MEPNVRFWIAERRSFVQRLLQWTELLDPTNLITSIEKIEKSRQLLFTSEDAYRFDVDDQRFLPLTVPTVFLSMMPAKGMKSMILPQVSLYAYTTGFTMVNGNASYSHSLPAKILLGAGVIASSTFFGLIPHLVQMKYHLDNPWIKRALPIVFLAQVSGMNVFASRSLEPVRGIEVMDKDGNVIGRSRRAGRKAIRETAVSRAVLFGTSAFIPEVFTYFFKRTQFFLQNPQSLWTLKLSCTLLVMGVMVPVSFSMFPQIGQIKYSKLEEEIQALTEETELFYNRGV
uniref:Sideroflexin 4 n=1 Tax=Marmota marmota marmota TaxID=9994 RepID=A0A8C5YKL0_MARMA